MNAPLKMLLPRPVRRARAAAVAAPASEAVTAIYVRLTKDESIQTGLSAPAQRAGGHEYAASRGLANVVVYEETEAVGGDIALHERPAGRRLHDDIVAGRVKHVVFRHPDRLTRDLAHWVLLRQLFLKHGVTLHTFRGPYPIENPADEMTSNVLAVFAQFERKMAGERGRGSKRQLQRTGRFSGGPPPFGFTSQARHLAELVAAGMLTDEAKVRAAERYPVRGHLYVDEREAEIVRTIFELYLAGWGCRRICNELDARGFRRRSSKFWHPDKVRRVVNDPVVCGLMPHDAVRYETRGRQHTPRPLQELCKGRHEAIIPEADWRAAQVVKARNTSTTTGRGDGSYAARKYALVGVARCGCCGGTMGAKSAAADKDYGYYCCLKRKGFGCDSVQGCGFPQLNTGIVDAAFWPLLGRMLNSPQLVDRVTEAARLLARSVATERRQATANDREAADIRRQLQAATLRLADADSDSPDEASALSLISQLKRRLRDAQSRDVAADVPAVPPDVHVDREKVAAHLASLASLVRDGASDAGKALVRSLVEHHDLQVTFVDAKTMRVSMRLRPPGGDEGGAAAEAYTVDLAETATLPKDRISAWVDEHRASAALCACGCGKPTQITRRHYWTGLPEFRSECRHRGMSRRRWTLARQADGYSGQDVARLLNVGRTTVNRMLARGELPTPQRSISRMLLFPKAAIDALARARAAKMRRPA